MCRIALQLLPSSISPAKQYNTLPPYKQEHRAWKFPGGNGVYLGLLLSIITKGLDKFALSSASGDIFLPALVVNVDAEVSF